MSIYGFAHQGDRTDESNELIARNETLLSNVFAVAAEMGNVPVLIMGDINTDVATSAAIQSALTTGVG